MQAVCATGLIVDGAQYVSSLWTDAILMAPWHIQLKYIYENNNRNKYMHIS